MNTRGKIDLEKVSKLQEVRKKMYELSELIDKLGDPILSDLDLLPKIYEIYTQLYARRGFAEGAKYVYNRKKFIFVVLYLYCPKALAGERMRTGLRKEISKLFNLGSSTPISDNSAGLMSQYYAYADFQTDVEILLDDIFEELDMLNNGVL